MKFILSVFAIFAAIYFYNKFDARNEVVSYDNAGHKIVRVVCSADSSYECDLSVGQHCMEGGYKTISKNISGTDIILMVRCGDEPSFLSRVFQ